MWKPRRLTTPWVSTACYRDSFTFLSCGLGVELNVPHYKRTVCYITKEKNGLKFTKIQFISTALFHIHDYVVESEIKCTHIHFATSRRLTVLPTSVSAHYHATNHTICLLGEALSWNWTRPSAQFTTGETATVLFCRPEQIASYEIDQSGKECSRRKITHFELEYMVYYITVWYKFHLLTACAVDISHKADEVYIKVMDTIRVT
jgi:hypothetical protein